MAKNTYYNLIHVVVIRGDEIKLIIFLFQNILFVNSGVPEYIDTIHEIIFILLCSVVSMLLYSVVNLYNHKFS